MSKGYTIRMPTPRLLIVMVLLTLSTVQSAQAQADDPGYKSAVFLLRQTIEPYNDGRHNVLLRGLRQLGDSDLKPLYNALSNSKYPPQRVHGLLGLAEVSPTRQLDLAALAEIKDELETVEVLSAAMDDELIDPAGMAAVMKWETLQLPVKQAVALRLLSKGVAVDATPFRTSVEIELDASTEIGKLMQYALGALVLAEAGDPAGTAALQKFAALRGSSADVVMAQLLDGALGRQIKSAGPIGLMVARDESREATLRMLGIQAALRLKAKDAGATWTEMFSKETQAARRIRLALIALDAAGQVEPSLYNAAINDSDELIRLIGQAGNAIANQSKDLLPAFTPLLESGQPLVASWLVVYCRREKPAQSAELLEAVIRAHASGEERNRGRMAEAAIAATQAICELSPDEAVKRLPALLDVSAKPVDEAQRVSMLQRRQIILLGIARAHKVNLGVLAATIGADDLNDLTTEALRLLIRARYGATLTAKEWTRLSDMVQGVGQVDLGLRVQLAWLYAEHLGKGQQAIGEALK